MMEAEGGEEQGTRYRPRCSSLRRLRTDSAVRSSGWKAAPTVPMHRDRSLHREIVGVGGTRAMAQEEGRAEAEGGTALDQSMSVVGTWT